jgi:radical SAM protein with 4Fe4S-binding SPASM domain
MPSRHKLYSLPAARGPGVPSEQDRERGRDRTDDPKRRRRRLESVTLVVTRNCNLACEYCINGRQRHRLMDWRVARTAIDLLVRHGHRTPELRFYGGEPCLEVDFMQKAARYLWEAAHPGARPRLHLTTNGTLIDDRTLRWLVDARASVLLSSDGVEAAQRRRSVGSFEKIDRLLRRAREEFPEFLSARVAAQITLTSANLPHLADSIEYFFDLGLTEIRIIPLITEDRGWRAVMIEDLRNQMSRVVRTSLELFRTSQQVPVVVLRDEPRRPSAFARSAPMCTAGAGRSAVVDCDGAAYPCPVFVASARFMDLPLYRSAHETARLGNIASRGFEERLAACREMLWELPIYRFKERKYSSYGSCSDCSAFSTCSVCPISIALCGARNDPQRVPDLACAFHRVSAEAAAAFWSSLRAAEPLPQGIGKSEADHESDPQ